MRIFGKKANQVSTTDVPPELQQYYSQPGLGARLRQISLFALPVLAFIAVLAAVIGGAIWLRSHSLSDIFGRRGNKPSTSQQATQQPSQQSQGSSSNAAQQNQPQPSSGNQQAATPDNSSSTGGVGSKTTTDGNTQQTNGSMPSTGPGETTVAIAGAMAVLGAAAFHARQLRRATKS